jgi:uncharacterized membrane protein
MGVKHLCFFVGVRGVDWTRRVHPKSEAQTKKQTPKHFTVLLYVIFPPNFTKKDHANRAGTQSRRSGDWGGGGGGGPGGGVGATAIYDK